MRSSRVPPESDREFSPAPLSRPFKTIEGSDSPSESAGLEVALISNGTVRGPDSRAVRFDAGTLFAWLAVNTAGGTLPPGLVAAVEANGGVVDRGGANICGLASAV